MALWYVCYFFGFSRLTISEVLTLSHPAPFDIQWILALVLPGPSRAHAMGWLFIWYVGMLVGWLVGEWVRILFGCLRTE